MYFNLLKLQVCINRNEFYCSINSFATQIPNLFYCYILLPSILVLSRHPVDIYIYIYKSARSSFNKILLFPTEKMSIYFVVSILENTCEVVRCVHNSETNGTSTKSRCNFAITDNQDHNTIDKASSLVSGLWLCTERNCSDQKTKTF